MTAMWTAVAVLVATYAAVMSEKVNRSIVALLGALMMIVLGILSQEQAVEGIDFNTIGLLVGMMIIVSITRKSGVFEYLFLQSLAPRRCKRRRTFLVCARAVFPVPACTSLAISADAWRLRQASRGREAPATSSRTWVTPRSPRTFRLRFRRGSAPPLSRRKHPDRCVERGAAVRAGSSLMKFSEIASVPSAWMMSVSVMPCLRAVRLISTSVSLP
jgi:hypothetical protein